ncbi:hypothetical protein FB45DRAFT_1053738 [Roridomyces roridus]|uniref:F-box domain-containing protein n=1 Tax=Roridomyces roridus TaxID=1738132 RepID=A0AAD7FVY6_9AGAR|nr:hypothetical protein FB45DRAFT_1053734 [Roridomyces roridus]KAJ7641147.1 hypothetical protein FB45DRAFT_1053738 [Roridomyces roridus]
MAHLDPKAVRAADRSRILQIDAEIDELEKRLHLLRVERNESQQRLDAYTYPVLALPNEIVSEIFLQSLPRIHGIALATPTLWRAISLIPSDFGEEQTRAWLESSGSCPLWIEVDPDVDDDDRQISTECLKTLLLHRERWQHVELTLPEYTLDLIKGPMPLLYRLSIDVPPAPIHLGPAGGSSLYRPSACPQDFPGLREISLTNVDPVDWLPWA